MSCAIPGLRGALVASLLLCTSASAATWSGNSVGLRYGSGFSEAGLRWAFA